MDFTLFIPSTSNPLQILTWLKKWQRNLTRVVFLRYFHEFKGIGGGGSFIYSITMNFSLSKKLLCNGLKTKQALIFVGFFSCCQIQFSFEMKLLVSCYWFQWWQYHVYIYLFIYHCLTYVYPYSYSPWFTNNKPLVYLFTSPISQA